ncbi:MAG: sodium-translocating pyrophosphatase [Candidatus Zixiibacteriota bacterium]|nr:MAG: sodium-translocating pyrophosphatase [candidate division Zixibacteria bacterium]
MDSILILTIALGLAALIFAFAKAAWIRKQEAGTERMQEIARFIREGAMAFLGREYRVLAIFAVAVAILLALAYWNSETSHPLVAVSFLIGASCSALAGFFGMSTATRANVRTANAARTGLPKALQVAFSGGTVMGMTVVGLGILGLSVLFLVYRNIFQPGLEAADLNMSRMLAVISGFSLGASSIALFARVGGGIYTKAADVGADLVGKVEAGIPEDDPRNPAVIADLVGDNVGDIAGMGADLFESYVGAIVGTMVLGIFYGFDLIILPLVLAGVGIIASILGTFAVRTKEGGNPQTALNTGTFGAGILMLVLSYPIIQYFVPQTANFQFGGVLENPGTLKPLTALGIFLATVAGLAAGIAIGLITEYYTSESRGPARKLAKQSETGAATNIIAGLGLGMFSTALPVIAIAIAIVASYSFAGLYGIAIAALGMLSTTGIQLAIDAYGPVADNSGGIAEMAELPKEVRSRTDKLDAVGNTTAAIGKGFAIASAALTALALFSAFQVAAGIREIDVTNPFVIAGLFIGGLMPFFFSSLAMRAVGEAAFDMIAEVRHQFKTIPGLMEGTAKADYARCVSISTGAALKRMVVPGLLAVVVPVIFGFWDKQALGGLLAGVTVTGVLMAIFMANAGGAWDNAKKYIEAGHLGGKGSPTHKAAVVGDTVGDPFKDTAGPSLNILIKLMSVVSLVIAPLIR